MDNAERMRQRRQELRHAKRRIISDLDDAWVAAGKMGPKGLMLRRVLRLALKIIHKYKPSE